ncbi:ThuA domain-containing protein [Clostridium sp. YIM B02505]|uniref:ThuA domain-containing protein n=1 Tax=Clostridium yunnanense TaxID=2800325 RepID=A0ABS1EKQ3_9CLOT|nr:ThuA domain-containing protein [Clostridium yunnanense]MBK1809922.1 ThuA domain-containing protein [Clostridium yunnanense]
MDQYKKILIIGEYENAMYHPLREVEKELRNIIGDEFQVIATDYFNRLSYEDISEYRLIISYTDCWQAEENKNLTAALLAFVAQGGALIVIHNGISLQINYELAMLIGAKFTMHPEATMLAYKNFNINHPIMKGCEEFQIHEEPYQFVFDNLATKEVLFYYEYNNILYEAAWSLEYGKGRVVYLSPGHSRASFEVEGYRNIIKRSIYWSMREEL